MEIKRHTLIIGAFLLIGILLFVIFVTPGYKINSHTILDNLKGDITLYKSFDCGCCEVYVTYLKKQGNSNIKVINIKNMNFIRKKYHIPPSLQSCHTSIIGNYFVEGHVPMEAIKKLLDEQPNIRGIALPNMPAGSPGMPGTKHGDFVIYSIDFQGNYREFMRI